MISAFATSMKVPELRSRILFTLAMIVIVRMGAHIPLPGVDVQAISDFIASNKNDGNSNDPLSGLGAILTIFSGGALQQCAIFALGIMPYISASIMTQLLGAVVPSWAKMMREEGGRQKMTKYTRIIAIVIAIVQGYFLTQTLRNPSILGLSGLNDLVMTPGPIFTLTTIFIIVTGTMLLMWIGDQITEKGIGNGLSLIISVNIIHSLPGAFNLAWQSFVMKDGQVNALGALGMVALILFMIIVIALVVILTQAQRRIPVQSAKRVVGNGKIQQGGTQYLPLKLNYSGVMPVIFATAILALPNLMIMQFFPEDSGFRTFVGNMLSQYDIWYYLISAALIFFFSYFWVATMFQPQQMSEDLKRSGSYIPGVRPGPATALFLDQTMGRLTTAGALYLTGIYFIPGLLSVWGGLNYIVTQFFGGTSLLILVGVLLDMMRQVETTLLQKNYDGFMKKGKGSSKYSHLQRGGVDQMKESKGLVILWVAIALMVLTGVIVMGK